jgi:hypothetical protein
MLNSSIECAYAETGVRLRGCAASARQAVSLAGVREDRYNQGFLSPL